MFSSDKNVETISQLIDLVRHYIGLQGEYLKLDVIDKAVRLLTVLIIALVLFTFLIITLIYLSFAAAYARHMDEHRCCLRYRGRMLPAVYHHLCFDAQTLDRKTAGKISCRTVNEPIAHEQDYNIRLIARRRNAQRAAATRNKERQ